MQYTHIHIWVEKAMGGGQEKERKNEWQRKKSIIRNSSYFTWFIVQDYYSRYS